MGTEVAVANSGYVRALMSLGGDDTPILKLNKQGVWTFGQENVELSEDDLVAVDPFTIEHGYIAFSEIEKAVALDVNGDRAELTQPIHQPLPLIDDLPEVQSEEVRDKKTGERREIVPEYRKQISLRMRIVDGPNEGTELVYKPTSFGGLGMCRRLAKEIGNRMMNGEDETQPVIALFSELRATKNYGDVMTPAFEIEEWVTNSGPAQLAKDEEPEQIEADTPEGVRDDTPPTETRTRSRSSAKVESAESDDDNTAARTGRRGSRRAAADTGNDGTTATRGGRSRSTEVAADDPPPRRRGRRS